MSVPSAIFTPFLRAFEKLSRSNAAIFSQLQRAALSVQLNIEKGYARRAAAQFRYHLNVAYGSAVETIKLLELLRDLDLLPTGQLEPMLQDASDCRGLLLGLIRRYTPAGIPSAP